MTEINKELLFSQEYDVGEKLVFSLFREVDAEQVTVSLCYQFQQPGAEMITCKRFFFPAYAQSYQSPYLSWYNLICCSNNYGPIPVVEYLNYAVQNGKKLAATIYPNSASDYMQMLSSVGDEYYCYPYHTREYAYMLYISRKGRLADYFELNKIMDIYTACGIDLNREKMQDYFEKELSWFGNEEVCPIQLHDCLGEEELAVTGLVLGYPIESTVALIKKDIDMCE